MVKICTKCNWIRIQKFWQQDWRQRYKCISCWYIFRNSRRIQKWKLSNDRLLSSYAQNKQTIQELSESTWLSKSTIHRKICAILDTSYHEHKSIRLNPKLSKYTQSVLLLDATFFWKKGSDTQWWLLVAQDALSWDILASKEILNETKEDYEVLLRALLEGGYPQPLFAVIDGRNGIEACIQRFYKIPVQTCQYHKIATIERYLLKYPRIESYRVLKRIARDMINTDKPTFNWMLDEFWQKYDQDFATKELDSKTLKYRYVHPRLHHAFKTLKRSINELFVYQDFFLTLKQEINTTNRIECVFSHLKQRIKLHRGLIKKRRLSLALSLLWKDKKWK